MVVVGNNGTRASNKLYTNVGPVSLESLLHFSFSVSLSCCCCCSSYDSRHRLSRAAIIKPPVLPDPSASTLVVVVVVVVVIVVVMMTIAEINLRICEEQTDNRMQDFKFFFKIQQDLKDKWFFFFLPGLKWFFFLHLVCFHFTISFPLHF